MSDTATEQRVAVARLKKAHRIVEVLRRHGADAEQARQITGDARDVVAELAGCKVNPDTGHRASPITWSMAVELLRLGENRVTSSTEVFTVSITEREWWEPKAKAKQR